MKQVEGINVPGAIDDDGMPLAGKQPVPELGIVPTLAGRIGLGFTFGGNVGHPYQLAKNIAQPGGPLTFMRDTVATWYQRGFELFLMHRMDGEHTPGDVMDADTTWEIARSSLNHVRVEWRFAIAVARNSMPKAKFVRYVGTHGPSLESRLVPGHMGEHMQRMWASVEDYIDEPNVMFAFDNAVNLKYDEHHPFTHFVRQVASYKARQGLPTIVESLPATLPTWQHHMPAIAQAGLSARQRARGDRRACSIYADTFDWLDHNDRHYKEAGQFPDVVDWLAACMDRPRTVPILSPRLVPEGATHDELLQKAWVRASLDGQPPQPHWRPRVKATPSVHLAGSGGGGA